MLKKDVQIGAVYVAKVSGKLVEVKILDAIHKQGYGSQKDRTHWLAKNLLTGREVTIKSAAKLRLRTTSKLDTSKPKTQTELLAEKNRAANLKHKADLKDTAELHRRIADGKITAGEALQAKFAGVKTSEIGVMREPLKIVVSSKRGFSESEIYCLAQRIGCNRKDREPSNQNVYYPTHLSYDAATRIGVDITTNFGFVVEVLKEAAPTADQVSMTADGMFQAKR